MAGALLELCWSPSIHQSSSSFDQCLKSSGFLRAVQRRSSVLWGLQVGCDSAATLP